MAESFDDFIRRHSGPSGAGDETNRPGIWSDIKRTGGQFVSSAGRTAIDLGAKELGADLEVYGDKVIRRNPSSINSISDIISNPRTAIREAVGEGIGQLGQGIAGGLGGRAIGSLLGLPFGPAGVAAGGMIGNAIGSLVPVAVQTYGGIRQEQDQQGIDDVGRAVQATAPAVALERFSPAGKLANAVTRKGRTELATDVARGIADQGALKYISKEAGKGFIKEGVLTEIPQTALERYGAYKDLTSEEALNEYGVSGFKGGVGGSMIEGGRAPFARMRAINSLEPTDLLNPNPPPPATAIPQTYNSLQDFGPQQYNQPQDFGPQQFKNPRDYGPQQYNFPQDFGPQPYQNPQEFGPPAPSPLDIGPPSPTTNLSPAVGSIASNAGQSNAAEAQAQAAKELGINRLSEKFKDEGAIQEYEADGVPKWLFGNKTFSTAAAAQKKYDEFVAKEAQKSDFQHDAEIKLLEARSKLSGKAYDAPLSPQDMDTRFGSMFVGINTPEELVARIDARIEGNKKSPKPDERFIEVLKNWKTVLQGGTLNVAAPGEPATKTKEAEGEGRGRGRPKSAATLKAEADAAAKQGAVESLSAEEYQARLDAEAAAKSAPATEAPAATEEAVAPTEPVTPARKFRRAPATQPSAPTAPAAQAQSEPATETAVAEKPVEERPQNPREVLQRQLLETAFGARKAQVLSLYLNDPGMTPEMLSQGTDQPVEEVNRALDSVNGVSPQVVQALNDAAQKLGLQRRQVAELLSPTKQTSRTNEVRGEIGDSVADEESMDQFVADPDKEGDNSSGNAIDAEDNGWLSNNQSYDQGSDTFLGESSDVGASKLDMTSLFDKKGEEGSDGPIISMGIIKSVGGSQGNIDAATSGYATLTENLEEWAAEVKNPNNDEQTKNKFKRWLLNGQRNLFYVAQRTIDENPVEVEKLQEELSTGTGLTEDQKKNKTARIKTLNEETVAAQEGLAKAQKVSEVAARTMLDKAKKESESKAKNNKEEDTGEPPLSSSTAVATVDAPNATVTKKRTRKAAKPENAPAQKLDPQREIAGETSESRARRMWNEQTPPGAPSHDDLPAGAKQEWAVAVRNGHGDRSDMQTIGAKAAKGVYGPESSSATQIEDQSDDPNVIDDPSLITEKKEQKLLSGKVEALPEAQQQTLEQHYNAKRDSSEFFQRLRADVVAYATKGAEAVEGVIRHIIKNIHAAVIAAMMIFNPLQTHQAEAVVVSSSQQLEQQIGEQPAEVPADAASRMSPAAQEAYRTLYPAMKADLQARNKFLIIADKPNARVFIFNPDGSLLLDKKTLYGAAVGDYLKGNNNLPSNRITPAGLFNLGLREGGKTAGEYDFKKVFVLDKAVDGEYSVTIMHSVWMKEKDAKQRAAALKSESSSNSRYSFGCINVDRNTFESLLNGHQQQMDGAKLFIVPDNQEQLKDFLAGDTKDDGLVREKVAQAPITRFKSRNGTIFRNLRGMGSRKYTPISLDAFAEFYGGDVSTAVSGALATLEAMGLSNSLDAIEDWFYTDELAPGIHGFYTNEITGKPAIVLTAAALHQNPETLFTIILHEIGHAVDLANGNSEFSDQVEFRIKLKDGVPVALPGGTVAAELIAHHKEGDSDFAKMLKYPLDRKYTDLAELRDELFAQLWAYSLTPGGMDFLQTFLPASAEFIERTHAEVKDTTYKKSPSQDNAPGRDIRSARFSRQDQSVPQPNSARQAAQKGLDLLPESTRDPLRVTATNILDAGKKAAFFSMFTDDLARMAEKFMGSVKTYVDVSRKMFNTRAKIATKIDDVVAKYETLPAHERKTVNSLIREMTMQGKWAFEPAWLKDADGKPKSVPTDSALKAKFDVLSKSAKDVITDVFLNGHEMLQQKKRVVEGVISAEIQDRLAKAKTPEDVEKIDKDRTQFLNNFNKILNINPDTPYAPLKRFGNYVSVGMSKEFAELRARADDGDEKARRDADAMAGDEKHYNVTFHETLGAAESANRKLPADLIERQAFQKDESNDVLYGTHEMHLAFGRMRNLLRGSQLNSAPEGEESKILGAAERLMSDLFIRTLSEASARKSELTRLGIAGADTDMMRAFATQGQADAHFIGNLLHNDEMFSALSAMRAEARKNTGSDRAAANRYLNEFMARHADSLNYKPNRVQDAVKRTTSLWMLAFSPMYYVQQLTQPFVMSLPVMAGRFGLSNSTSALMKAYDDLSPLIRGVGIDKRIDFTKAPPGVRDLLQKMIDAGKIDLGVDLDQGRFDLANSGEGNVEVGINAMKRADRFISGANGKVESINRAATAVAAYRLYLSKNPGKIEDATNYAERILHETHGSYDGFNNPRLTGNWAGGWGKVITQFKKFQLVQITLLARLFHDSFHGASATEKSIARQSLAYTLGTAFALGGAMGLPAFGMISFLINAMFGDDDDPDDEEEKMRKAIGDPYMARLLTRGIPASLGVDVSQRFGMGSTFSIMPFVQPELNRNGVKDVVTAALGPFVGLTMKMADGLGLIKDGSYEKGLEKLLPTGLGKAMEGIRIANEGVSMRNGDTVVDPKDVSMADSLFQALGVPTNNITDRSRLQKQLVDAQKFYNDRTGDIKRDYKVAQKEKDTQGMKDARAAFEKLQKSRVEHGFTRQPMSVLMNSKESEILGGVKVNKGNRGFVQQQLESR